MSGVIRWTWIQILVQRKQLVMMPQQAILMMPPDYTTWRHKIALNTKLKNYTAPTAG